MPRYHGTSNKVRNKNVKVEIAAGKPIKQAVAIAYSEQRQDKKHTSPHYGPQMSVKALKERRRAKA